MLLLNIVGMFNKSTEIVRQVKGTDSEGTISYKDIFIGLLKTEVLNNSVCSKVLNWKDRQIVHSVPEIACNVAVLLHRSKNKIPIKLQRIK